MKGYSISWYSSDEQRGSPRLAHRSALPCGKKLYLVSTAAIWWLDGLLDLAQLCSLSCPLKVLWGHWDAGEEPSQKMESPLGSPLPVGRLTRPEKSQLRPLPALSTPPLILPDSSVSVPRLGFSPLTSPQVLKPNAVSPCQHAPGIFSDAAAWHT